MQKEINVVMLSSDNESCLGFIGNSQLMMFNPDIKGSFGIDYKNLYFLSDEKNKG